MNGIGRPPTEPRSDPVISLLPEHTTPQENMTISCQRQIAKMEDDKGKHDIELVTAKRIRDTAKADLQAKTAAAQKFTDELASIDKAGLLETARWLSGFDQAEFANTFHVPET